MHIFSNGQNTPNNVQTNQGFGATIPRTNMPFSQQNYHGGFQQLPFPQYLLQNLIQQIITQLLYSLLNQNQDSNQATPFNDIFRGGDGAELIQGLGGNDQLFGNGGNDILKGGQGHDYLNGGQGNDSLFGGTGNDLLQDDSGRNHLVGGDGYDTLRFNGKFSDYTFEKNNNNNGFIVTNNATGDFSTIETIENFQFTDGSITQAQLINHIDASQNVVLTGDQDSAIRERFDIGNGSSYQVFDRDASQTLSEGDELRILVGGDAVSTITLTAEDVAAINGNPFPQELNLTNEQQAAIAARFNNIPPPNLFDGITTQYTGTTIDQDGNGQLTEGDIVKLHQSGGLLGLNETIDHVLTADDIAAIEEDRSNSLLDISNGLSNEQKERLNNALFGDTISLLSPSVNSIFDHNSDGKLSVGDYAEIRTFDETTGTEGISYEIITQAHIDAFLEGKNTEALAALQENQQKWENSGAGQNGYSFRLDRSAFSPPEAIRPTISHVQPNGDVFDVFADTGSAVPENYNQANASIDSLFAIIQNAIDSQADEIKVEYDPTTGYPTSIFIDYEAQIADEELRLDISNLVVNS